MNEGAVADLPDYPALACLASALWSDGHARGAAVLVGAGFSRNAELAGGDTKPPPLWSDLRDAMAKTLYQERSDDAPRDALRLAEEFRAYLGQAVLIEFMRQQIPDESWRPGSLHRDLMALPWADVLTTNYDTLLESASDKYKVVVDAADLVQVRGPRVIKLHGSINANARLVIAEEDYRTYPSRSAAFVNTARQVFLENELCLIGFSGDDPNFLQWSGWVRDNLGEGARRIYLVGSLGLTLAKRRLLESRNIAPIDFAPLTGKLDRAEAEKRACELFLAYLVSKKPGSSMEWQPVEIEQYRFIPADSKVLKAQLADHASAATLLEKLSAVWDADKRSCPEWLVVPKSKRQAVSFGTNSAPRGYDQAIGSLDTLGRAKLLAQSLWRHSVTLTALDNRVESAVAAVVREDTALPRETRFHFLRMLLREARYNRNEERFREIDRMLSAEVRLGTDAYADLIAQRLLWARDGLDYAIVSRDAPALVGPDPMWRFLRAALHCDCGETELAKPLIAEARADLVDRQRRDRRSVWVASRLAWAEVFAKAFRMSETWARERNAPDGSLKTDYDAEDEIDQIHREVRAERLRQMEKPQGFQPLFGPGTYINHNRTITFNSAPLGHAADTVFRLVDMACLPLRIENVDILASLAREALDIEPQSTIVWYLRLLRAISSHSCPTLERNFDIVSVAQLDSTIVSQLINRGEFFLFFQVKTVKLRRVSGFLAQRWVLLLIKIKCG